VLGVVLSARRADAFEREWHLGAGLGAVLPKDAYGAGGAVALHLAYGLSDMFDARLEARTSLHQLSEDNLRAQPEERRRDYVLSEERIRALTEETLSFSQATVGVAYKLDIIEWVPYLGVRAGYYRFGTKPFEGAFAPGEAYEQSGGVIGTMLGVDYAFSRSAGIGLELDYDTLLPTGGAFGALLHAEYRWGF
jgi:hypothetical protein